MEENEMDIEPTQEENERPPFLNVLCILSFIASGVMILSWLIIGASKKMSEMRGIDLIEKIKTENQDMFTTPESIDMLSSMEIMFTWPYMIVSLILAIVSLFGVIKMWNLKKQGFYMYSAAGIIGIAVPMLFGLPFGLLGAFITLAFIALYYQNTKVMN